MVVWTFFHNALLWDWTQNWLLQSCGYCWVVQICWHIEFSTLSASSFRIWNSLAGVSSPPWALFVVMLPKVHLTSYFKISDSRWVITPSWLSGLLRPFLYSSSVYSFHLFLIFSASVLYFDHILMKCSLGISIFLKDMSSVSYSVVFLYSLALFT